MLVVEKRENGSKRVHTVNNEPSKTDQQYTEDCCANSILAKYAKTGQINHIAKVRGQYADVSGVEDLHGTMLKIKDMEAEFLKMSPELRAKFGNKPEGMIQWLSDPKNDEEAVKLGLKLAPGTSDSVSKAPKDAVKSEVKEGKNVGEGKNDSQGDTKGS